MKLKDAAIIGLVGYVLLGGLKEGIFKKFFGAVTDDIIPDVTVVVNAPDAITATPSGTLVPNIPTSIVPSVADIVAALESGTPIVPNIPTSVVPDIASSTSAVNSFFEWIMNFMAGGNGNDDQMQVFVPDPTGSLFRETVGIPDPLAQFQVDDPLMSVVPPGGPGIIIPVSPVADPVAPYVDPSGIIGGGSGAPSASSPDAPSWYQDLYG